MAYVLHAYSRPRAHLCEETTLSAWGKVLLYGKHKYCVEFVRPLAFVPFPSEAQLLVQQVSVSAHARARAREGQSVCVRARAHTHASIRECVHQSVYSCARPPVRVRLNPTLGSRGWAERHGPS